MLGRAAADGIAALGLLPSSRSDGRRKRLTELRTGKGKPPTPAELAKLHRANMKRIWERAPWWPGATIWLSPALEAAFIEDCRRAGLDLAEIAPVWPNERYAREASGDRGFVYYEGCRGR